jgi:hypothetical protein
MKIGVGLIGVGRRGYNLAESLIRQRAHVDLDHDELYEVIRKAA